jgi:hypothetical protein
MIFFGFILLNVPLVNQDAFCFQEEGGPIGGVKNMISLITQVPNSFGQELRTCLQCALVKTYDHIYLLGTMFEGFLFLSGIQIWSF